ncbi:MAG: PqqD family protein [Gemmatimonadota bacterium]
MSSPSHPAAEPDARPRGRSDVVFRPLKDEWVILDPTTDRVHVLNLAAAMVWLCCDGTRTRDAIARAIWEDFDGRPSLEGIRADVDAALANLDAQGLLR